MGFDLNGINATSKKGEYFRNNVWWWRPLAEYVVNACGLDDEGWWTNDGHVVSKTEAELIVKTLTEKLASGEVSKYSRKYARACKALPDVECKHCKGTGKRDDEYVKGECNACKGKGQVRPFSTWYPFSTQNVRDFRDFVKDSGGFAIY